MKGRGKNSNLSIYARSLSLNVGVLDKVFSNGDIITPAIVIEKKLVSARKSSRPTIKILSGGDLTKKIIFSGFVVSTKAKEKIEKAGGSVA